MPERVVDRSVADALRPFRRRLRMLRVMESLLAACAYGVALAAVLVLVARPGPLLGLASLAMGALAGVLVLTGAAFAFPPSLQETAAIVDREYSLQSLAITALQFSRDADEVSRRIVADARATLARLDRRQLMWFVPARTWWAAAAAVLGIVTSLVAARSDQQPGQPVVITRSTIDTAPTSRLRSGRPQTPATIATGAPDVSGNMSSAAGQNRQSRSNPAPSHAADAIGRSHSNPAGERPGESADDEVGRSHPDAPGSPTGAIASADHVVPGSAPRGSSGAGGAAAGGSGATGKRGGAGGVSGGAEADQTVRSAARADAVITAEQYQQAVAHAEGAIARQRVPAGLRGYVRDYFLSLRGMVGE